MTALHRTPFPILAAGLLAAAAHAAPASRLPAQEPASAEATDERALDQKRLLTLADGTVLRGRTRWHAGAWERRVGPDWLAVDGEVVQHRTVGDALAEARRMAGDVGRDDHARRAELARWMAGQGLYPEAIAELDRILRDEPENAAAQRLLDETSIPLELSDDASRDRGLAVKELVRLGASGSPATREVAARRLAETGLDLDAFVRLELNVPQYKRRELAAFVARRAMRGSLREELASRSILDGWEGVRREASYGLRDARDAAVIGPAVRALGSEHATVRANAAESLGNMGYPLAVEPLMAHLSAASGGATGTRANLFAGLQTAYVMDYDVEIAQGASIADPVLAVQASGVVFDVRSTVQMSKVIELRTTMRSLRQLTGEKIPDDPGKWKTWWERNAEQWRADRARSDDGDPAD